ncbi:hypothetical protein JXA32_13555 [Candidatus Sumerlaeota bacterium]|nr:hypothetical protein [Candidatus Sumerlaeota bacterium]
MFFTPSRWHYEAPFAQNKGKSNLTSKFGRIMPRHPGNEKGRKNIPDRGFFASLLA